MSNGLHGDRRELWLDGFQSGRNWLGLALRNFMSWGPGTYREPVESKQALFQGQPNSAQKAADLMARYALHGLAERTSRQRYCEVLAYLEWLEQAIQADPQAFNALFTVPVQLRWLDAGAKNWAYVDALHAFIQTHRHDLPFRLDGIELDPNRRYVNFQTRRQAAQTFIRAMPSTRYHEGDLLAWRSKTHIISHFLPFVFKDPLLAWGLPLAHFKPYTLLRHQLSLLVPGGLLLIVNQGEAEAQAQQALLQQVKQERPIRYQSLGQLPASFIQYRYPRYGWICVNEGP